MAYRGINQVYNGISSLARRGEKWVIPAHVAAIFTGISTKVSAMSAYFVYRVFCTISGKSYIGITRDLKQRWRIHRSYLNRGKHRNRKLQAAWNKYGAGAFEWSVIEECADLEQVKSREIELILEFDSYKHGFNLTEGGDNTPDSTNKVTIWNGVEYRSLRAAAEANGHCAFTFRGWVSKGLTCDADIPGLGEKPVLWNGVQYSSVGSAAKAIGIAKSTLRKRLSNGYSSDSEVPGRKTSIRIESVSYPSISAAARALGIPKTTLFKRLAKATPDGL